MCRLLAFSFHQDTKKHAKISSVDSFKALAKDGAVLPMSLPGHGDGWGIVTYSARGDVAHQHISVTSAHLDDTYEGGSFFKDSVPQSGLVHLRKKTVGELSLKNTHPFVDGIYSFIHNGTVSYADAYSSLAGVCAGDTDSERLFRRFLELKSAVEVSTLDAFKAMLQEVRVMYPEHSALNTMLHDGERIYVSRSINSNNKKYTESDLLNYYTLHLGETESGDVFITSERVLGESVSYKPLPNHSVSIINTAHNTVQTVPL